MWYVIVVPVTFIVRRRHAFASYGVNVLPVTFADLAKMNERAFLCRALFNIGAIHLATLGITLIFVDRVTDSHSCHNNHYPFFGMRLCIFFLTCDLVNTFSPLCTF